MENDCSTTTAPVWRESATLIICAKDSKNPDGFDYELLLLKRSSHTAIVPNQVVFPGGIYDPTDETVAWLKYFHEFGITQQSLNELLPIDNIVRPKIFVPQGTGCYDRFFQNSIIWAREISLRINAIRETFEEVGVLMCRTHDQVHTQSGVGFYLKNFGKIKWQKAVHTDPRNFLVMCRELQVVPDLWGLYEWSCWTSPAIIKKGYETAFFITFLNERPDVTCEESEVTEHLWLTPNALLCMARNAEIFILPPQFYEMSRFAPCKSYEYLKTFARKHNGKNKSTYDVIVYSCTDSVVAVLPGDDYFTGCPRLATEYRNLDISSTEFRRRSKRMHRIENGGAPNAAIYLNVEPLDGHLMPLSGRQQKHNL